MLVRRGAFLVLFFALAGQLPAPAEAATTSSAVEFAARLYRTFLPLAFGEAGANGTPARVQHDHAVDRFHAEFLTPKFARNLGRLAEESDSDPICLCQDWDTGWLNMRGRLLSAAGDHADVLMSFGSGSKPYQLVAHLKASGASWRLDDVSMSPDQVAEMAANARPSAIDFSKWSYEQTVGALSTWATRRQNGFSWELAEVARCRFRERFGARMTVGDRHYFTSDTVFDIGGMTPSGMSVQQDQMFFNCRNNKFCGTLSYSDGRAPTRRWNSVEVHYHDGRGPEVVGAMERLAVLCQ